MRTAKNLPAGRFHSVPDDFAAAMSTFRRDHRDGALETVKDMGFALRVTSKVLSYSFPHKSHLAITDYFVRKQEGARLFYIQHGRDADNFYGK